MLQIQPSDTGQTELLTTFFVRGAHCALNASGVQEVIRLGPVTKVRHAPEEVLGVVNLRGRIVTVLDLGMKLGFERAVPGPESRIFIVEDQNEFIGLLVDRAGEAIELEADRLAPTPANVSQMQSRFFQGVHRVGGQVIALMDIGQVLATNAQ